MRCRRKSWSCPPTLGGTASPRRDGKNSVCAVGFFLGHQKGNLTGDAALLPLNKVFWDTESGSLPEMRPCGLFCPLNHGSVDRNPFASHVHRRFSKANLLWRVIGMRGCAQSVEYIFHSLSDLTDLTWCVSLMRTQRTHACRASAVTCHVCSKAFLLNPAYFVWGKFPTSAILDCQSRFPIKSDLV